MDEEKECAWRDLIRKAEVAVTTSERTWTTAQLVLDILYGRLDDQLEVVSKAIADRRQWVADRKADV